MRLSPVEVVDVYESSRSLEVHHRINECEYERQPAHHYVADSQEVVLPARPSRGAEHHRLGAPVREDREV